MRIRPVPVSRPRKAAAIPQSGTARHRMPDRFPAIAGRRLRVVLVNERNFFVHCLVLLVVMCFATAPGVEAGFHRHVARGPY